MYGLDERVIPGNAAAVQADAPFGGLAQFGSNFLGKFQISLSPAALLESITFLDTPGVLSGDKQRLGRSYDYVRVCEWYAERADMILLLFDAHKLDISDELKRTMTRLRPYEEKIRVVLNKADQVNQQQLMRVYGALMWSLGKVIETPEVVRVYIGSFWNPPKAPEHDCQQAALLEAEQTDLLSDLHNLPRNAAIRRINEIIKRAKLARVHAIILNHLRTQMPTVWGRSGKQNKLIANLQGEFAKVQQQHRLPPGDFPDLEKFQETLRSLDIGSFPRLSGKLLGGLEEALSIDLPGLMMQFPNLSVSHQFHSAIPHNPFDGGFATNTAAGFVDVPESWELTSVDKKNFCRTFYTYSPNGEPLSGNRCREILGESGLSTDELACIWALVDVDRDGALSLTEFCMAMQLIKIRLSGGPIPQELPVCLRML